MEKYIYFSSLNSKSWDYNIIYIRTWGPWRCNSNIEPSFYTIKLYKIRLIVLYLYFFTAINLS